MVFDREAGRRFPTAAVALRAAARVRIDVRAAVGRVVPGVSWPAGDEARTVDIGVDPLRSRELRAFWSRAGVDRMLAGAEGEFAFNLFSVSSADLERLCELQREYFQQLRGIVARSEPAEHIVLANLHLLPLAGPR